MNNGLLQLLKIQEVDKQLHQLEKVKNQYPAEIAQRQLEIQTAETALQQQLNQLQDLAREQRRLERELETSKASLKKHEERFAEVTTNKEYDALQAEIEACKNKISEYETHILECIETAEQLRLQVELEGKDVEGIRQSQQARIDELQQKLDSVQGEVHGVQAQRQAVLQDIDHRLLRAYERSPKLRGTRVAPVKKGACGICFRQLPAQQKSNVRRNDQIYLCESCGAILVWHEEST